MLPPVHTVSVPMSLEEMFKKFENVFFTSDTHFGHARILELGRGRPFKNIQEHNEDIVRNWNAVVGVDDLVVHLGDVALGDRATTLAHLDRCLGYKVLVPGNHDSVSSLETNARRERFMPLYLEHFDEIWTEVVEDNGIVYSHYPPAEISDHTTEDRYPHLRPVDGGGTLFIHGHTHQEHVVTPLKTGSIAVSVGVDANGFTPVNFKSIIKIWEGRQHG
jgi:calcineurin-like phosphoesterase family protein